MAEEKVVKVHHSCGCISAVIGLFVGWVVMSRLNALFGWLERNEGTALLGLAVAILGGTVIAVILSRGGK